MRDAYIDAHDQNELRRPFAPHRSDEIGSELLREAHVAAIAGLQIAVVRRSIDRRNIEPLELAGLRQFPAQLLGHPHQALVLAVVARCTAAFMIGAILAYHPSRGSSRRGPAGGET